MKISNRLALTLGIGLSAFNLAAADPNALLNQVQKVYLLPMAGGLDQYLANQLTKKGLFEVVTDPKLADSVMTEAIGNGFEVHLKELLPPPPPVAEVKPEPAKTKKGRDAEESGLTISSSGTPRSSSFGRGRGNLFLVDLKSRSVVWSTYRLPKSRTPPDLDRTSIQITDELSRDLKQK